MFVNLGIPILLERAPLRRMLRTVEPGPQVSPYLRVQLPWVWNYPTHRIAHDVI